MSTRGVFRRLCATAALSALLSTGESEGQIEPTSVQAVENAITELDLEQARRLLEKASGGSLALSFERARLAVYTGDCESAQAILDAPNLAESNEGRALGELAKSCAGATAGATTIDDPQHGLWIRLQDASDRPMVAFVVAVASAARNAIRRDLGVELPRPLRIDLVRDLFSLSAVTGLPLNAAETTGTVAVARWGRVTMLSPRATPLGYPWQDTLAHEITHLALSRATRDRAPLWLQEGIAKRQETRWRPQRAFDDAGADHVARTALKSGRSVGVDKLGPSIALLPTPEAASIAFAEVTSFTGYWIAENGEAALRLLLSDLKGLGVDAADPAMRSVTGYDVSAWIERWKKQLVATEPKQPEARPQVRQGKTKAPPFGDEADLTRRIRLGDLLYARGHGQAAARELEPVVEAARDEPAACWRAARALIAADRPDDARRRLGKLEDMKSPHGPWLGLSGRFAREAGDPAGAAQAFELGMALDLLAEEVACEGQIGLPGPGRPKGPLPADGRQRALCEAARDLAARRSMARE
jgi:hypothetical protein